MTFEQESAQEQKESVEAKKERLRPVFEQSLEVFRNPDQNLAEGALTITRDNDGKTETFHGLVILTIDEDFVELGWIEEDGQIGDSACMSWEELVDASKE